MKCFSGFADVFKRVAKAVDDKTPELTPNETGETRGTGETKQST